MTSPTPETTPLYHRTTAIALRETWLSEELRRRCYTDELATAEHRREARDRAVSVLRREIATLRAMPESASLDDIRAALRGCGVSPREALDLIAETVDHVRKNAAGTPQGEDPDAVAALAIDVLCEDPETRCFDHPAEGVRDEIREHLTSIASAYASLCEVLS